MVRRVCVLLLGAGLALSQEGRDDEGITIDEVPSGPEEAPSGPRPARTPGQTPATVTIRKKAYALTLPEDWVLTEQENAKSELSWEVFLPGSKVRASLDLFHDAGDDARSAPYRLAELVRREREGAKVETFREPLPRTVARFPDTAGEWANESVFLAKGYRCYTLRLSCIASDLPGAEADLLAAAKSFTADVEPWPPIPKGYEMSTEGAWRIARARAVTASLAPLRKALVDTEKSFKRVHGALPKSDAPFVVFVHASKRDAAAIEPEAAENREDFYADGWRRRLFAIPLAKDDARQRGWLAGEVHRLLLTAKYGDISPSWIWVGECTVARAEAQLGKPLPSLEDGFLDWLSDLKLHRLDELVELAKNDSEAWGKESLFHVAALRGGKYRAQYKAFFDDYAETADGVGAFERHLAPIDPEQMRAATYDYFQTKIKAEKRE
jgi:hypothetical protein